MTAIIAAAAQKRESRDADVKLHLIRKRGIKTGS